MSKKKRDIEVPERPADEPYLAPWWTSDWNLRQVDKTYNAMLNKGGEEMAFEIHRDVEHEGHEMTFSPEAVDECLISMRAWLYSRLHRFYSEHDGRGAKNATIVLKVSLDE
jgi:hypothetical protein